LPELAFINGGFVSLDRAMVHVEDRGYQFADAVYEVVRTYGGRPFALAEHLDRLWRSFEGIQLVPNFTRSELTGWIQEGVKRAGFPEAMVYVQVSRGQARRHRGIPANAAPVLVITVRALPDSAQLRADGITCITVPDQRWGRCDIKSVALLANVLAYNQAKQAGASDAIFVETDGTVNEATAGNIFLVKESRLITPSKSPKLLGGITRDKLLLAATAAGIGCEERRVTTAELLAADEMFLSSTTAEVVPVLALNGSRIGDGRPGRVSARLYEAFVRAYVGLGT
jgi:D-alanine transaminase